MTKMEGIAAEVSQKLKSAIKAKLTELGAYVDDELSNYVMVMVTNRRSKTEMDRELQLFLGTNTSAFTGWLQTVWQKLEQVTISNSAIDTKRKATDKKKKTKKSSKSASESEDEKKHKKKRKSSVIDSVNKETKKRKLQPKENESKKKDEELQTNADSDSDSGDQVETNKKLSKDAGAGSANEEEDFLNIKEDFESEFLSDNEGTSASKNKTSSGEAKTSQKVPSEIPGKIISLKRNKVVIDAKDNADKVKLISDNTNISKVSSVESTKETKQSISRKPLVRDYKAKSPSRLKTRRQSPSPPAKSRSRSKSPSQGKIIKLKRRVPGSTSGEEVEEDFRTKIQRSRLKSVAAGSAKNEDNSRSRSRSPLTSAATKKLRQSRENSGVLDARELINRKRAMCMVNEPATKEKNELGVAKTTISGGKIVRIRDRDSSKENCRTEDEDCVTTVDDDWSENGDSTDKNHQPVVKISSNITNKLMVSRCDGKRSVVVHPSVSAKSLSPPSSRRVDLRGLKRTVYIEDDEPVDRSEDVGDDDMRVIETTNELPEEKPEKKKKLCVDQVVKYIKSDKTVASTVVKLPKLSRPKTSPAQAASSTLIRKAMADAHKSLTSLKEETNRKKEAADIKTSRQRHREKNSAIQLEVSVDEEVPDQKEVSNLKYENVEDVEKPQIQPAKSQNDCDHIDDKQENMEEEADPPSDTEEYEPAISLPQFVVTLTGLDSKLFPKNDTNDLMSMLDEDLEPEMNELEEINKNKPKPQDRCKYYPNCLAGDQCLFYHPTIPCKLFPNCKFGNSCLYVHPKCKFDSMCTRYDCTFLHTAPRAAQPAPPRHAPPPPMMTAQPCKFYYNCVNPVCPFQHPKICRFDRFCTNKNCTFSHTSITHVSMVSKDKLKWSRPKDGDLKLQPDSETSVQ